ncbi:Regulator of protease activity HflC, stomatin/prohibitin superfamily [Rhizobiales bacterium GAS188]|nr:Regulator of protease activity HflC, stomatin/prohibitin superfamily [Rhizobiales bacterium GAS188]
MTAGDTLRLDEAPEPKGAPELRGAWAQSLQIVFRLLFAGMLALAALWGVNNIRKIPAESRAVVLRFGEFDRVRDAGLLLAWPRPIEEVVIIPARATQIRLGNANDPRPPANNYLGLRNDAAARSNVDFFLTGDGGVVHLDAHIYYQITDPSAYVLAAAHVEPALYRIYESSALSLIAARELDDILVARPERPEEEASLAAGRRQQLHIDLVTAMNARLADLARRQAGLGVEISRIDLSAALRSRAAEAYNDVLTAVQGADQRIAEARTGAERSGQQADQKHDQIIMSARAVAAERLSQATSQTAEIAALADQMKTSSREALLTQVFNERIGPILKKVGQVTAVDPSNGTRLIIPGGDQ